MNSDGFQKFAHNLALFATIFNDDVRRWLVEHAYQIYKEDIFIVSMLSEYVRQRNDETTQLKDSIIRAAREGQAYQHTDASTNSGMCLRTLYDELVKSIPKDE